MKNKKVLNICLLTVALLALFTFVLPIKKFEFSGEQVGFITVMFYFLNGVLIVCLTALITMAIINLFKDDYKLVKLMEIMAMVGFSMVFLMLVIFACSVSAKINVGYLLVAIEVFICANFSQMVRLTCSVGEIKENLTHTTKNLDVKSDNKETKNNADLKQ